MITTTGDGRGRRVAGGLPSPLVIIADDSPPAVTGVGWADAIGCFVLALTAAGRPESTIGLRRYQLRRLAAEVAPLGPWQVSGPVLVAWIGSHGWAGETLRSMRSAVRGFYRWACAAGYIECDPALALPSVKPSDPNPRPAPEAAYRSALARSGPRTRLILRLAAEMGLRRGEVARARVEDVERDLSGWTLRVVGKGGRVRRLPLPDQLAATLRSYGREHAAGGWLFPGRVDGHLSAHYVGKLASAALPDAWAMHSLRHRFATAAFQVDRDLLTVQALLGHASPVTTRLYVRVPDDALRATVTAVGRL